VYITITVLAGTGIGRTVDASVGPTPTPGRVTLLNEQILRIEPDQVCRIIAATTEDGQTSICAVRQKGTGLK